MGAGAEGVRDQEAAAPQTSKHRMGEGGPKGAHDLESQPQKWFLFCFLEVQVDSNQLQLKYQRLGCS